MPKHDPKRCTNPKAVCVINNFWTCPSCDVAPETFITAPACPHTDTYYFEQHSVNGVVALRLTCYGCGKFLQ